jgi:hypothetical protein
VTDRYLLQSWNVICDRCGHQYKAHELAREWTGLRVCRGPGTNECFEHRHLQEAVRGRKDEQAPPWARPEPQPVFVPAQVWNDETKAWEPAP